MSHVVSHSHLAGTGYTSYVVVCVICCMPLSLTQGDSDSRLSLLANCQASLFFGWHQIIQFGDEADEFVQFEHSH